MSATSVYVSGATPSPLPPIPGPGKTTTVVGHQPAHGGTLPETGFNLLPLLVIAAFVAMLAMQCARRAGRR